MKISAVKEINECDGCINNHRGMCLDFTKQRMTEGLPSCSKGFIYVLAKEPEYKEITLESIKITQELLDDLGAIYLTQQQKDNGFQYGADFLELKCGRKVEIIE